LILADRLVMDCSKSSVVIAEKSGLASMLYTRLIFNILYITPV
jgi:hypothetical protein